MKEITKISLMIILLTMGIFVTAFALNVSAGCIQSHVQPSFIMQKSVGFANANYTRDGLTSTNGYGKIGDWYVAPAWGGSHSDYKLYGVYVYGDEYIGGSSYDIKLDFVVDGDIYANKVFTANTWTSFIFDDLYDYDESVLITLDYTFNLRSMIRVKELHFIYVRQNDPLLTDVYPYHADDCVKTNTNMSFRYVVYAGCPSSFLNVSIEVSDDGSNYQDYTYYNISGTGSLIIDEYFYCKFVKEYGERYYWRLTALAGGGDYPEFTQTDIRSFYFDTEICLPPNSPPNYPILDFDFDIDCWEMFGVCGNVSRWDLLVYNSSDDSYSSFNESVSDGDIYNGTFWWNSSSSSYDNVTDLYFKYGYWFYAYNDSCWLIYNCTCPDIDESIHIDGYYNASLNYDSWVNISYDSWFNDSSIDTLETTFALIDQFINNSGGGSGWVSPYPFTLSLSDSNISCNVSVTANNTGTLLNSSVNETNYLFISDLVFSPEITILIFIGLFFYFADTKQSAILHILLGVIATIGGIYYLGWEVALTSRLMGFSLIALGIYSFYLSAYYRNNP